MIINKIYNLVFKIMVKLLMHIMKTIADIMLMFFFMLKVRFNIELQELE